MIKSHVISFWDHEGADTNGAMIFLPSFQAALSQCGLLDIGSSFTRGEDGRDRIVDVDRHFNARLGRQHQSSEAGQFRNGVRFFHADPEARQVQDDQSRKPARQRHLFGSSQGKRSVDPPFSLHILLLTRASVPFDPQRIERLKNFDASAANLMGYFKDTRSIAASSSFKALAS